MSMTSRSTSAFLLSISFLCACAWGEPHTLDAAPQNSSNRPTLAEPQTNGAGFVGVRLADIDANHAKNLKLGEERGVEVKAVMQGSAADQAGILPGDVLLSYNGEAVLGAEQLSRLVRETPPGRKVKVQYWRAGKTQTTLLTVGSAPNMQSNPTFGFPSSWNELSMDIPTPMLLWHNSSVGIAFEGVDSQLAQYFGVNSGVLVRFVQRGSPADKAGVRAGDVIYSVSQQTLSSEHDFSLLIKQRGTSVPISLMRDHKRLELMIALPQ
jgi:serine protease Do